MENLTYQQRLEKLNMTTLLERRMRGDLIETFKILKGFSNYGSTFFNLSDRTQNLIYRATNIDFFSERVINYWNKLPEDVKDKRSVNSFKNALDTFRSNGLRGGFPPFCLIFKSVFISKCSFLSEKILYILKLPILKP